MNVVAIGKNIHKYRKQKKLTQEKLAEMAKLSPNYLGVLERGEKTPSLETLINIANALGVSADMLLCDVIETGYTVKSSLLSEKISKLSPKDRERIFEVVEVMIKHSIQIMP